MEELNQAMVETEIKKETKDAIIESTIENVTNLEVQTALGIAKIKETSKNIEADTALKIAQATKEAGEASKKPIELKIEQTNKEIIDLEKSR